ncbi:Membrane-bound protease(CAAX family) [Streptococcus sp. ZB199]|nr:Membrane-bound protease(CAAX family) [Streptococcus sp. ZB199]
MILTWVAYRYKRIEYSICLHMTLNALAYYYPVVILLCLLPVSRVFFHDKL